MITCAVCRQDVTTLMHAGVAVMHEDVAFCSAECCRHWRQHHGDWGQQEWWQAVRTGWLTAAACWLVFFYGLYEAPIPVGNWTVGASILIGAAVGSIQFWRQWRQVDLG